MTGAATLLLLLLLGRTEDVASVVFEEEAGWTMDDALGEELVGATMAVVLGAWTEGTVVEEDDGAAADGEDDAETATVDEADEETAADAEEAFADDVDEDVAAVADEACADEADEVAAAADDEDELLPSSPPVGVVPDLTQPVLSVNAAGHVTSL